MSFDSVLKEQYNLEEESVNTTPISMDTNYYSSLPSFYQAGLDRFAATFFGINKKSIVVTGKETSGKTFFLEAFSKSIHHYINKTPFDDVVMFNVSLSQSEKFLHNQYIRSFRTMHNLSENTIICLVTTKLQAFANVMKFAEELNNVRVIIELSEDAYHHNISNPTAPQQYELDNATVFSVGFHLTSENLIDLLMVSTVQVMNTAPRGFPVERIHVETLVDYVLSESGDSIIEECKLSDKDICITLPSGVWATILQNIVMLVKLKIDDTMTIIEKEEAFEFFMQDVYYGYKNFVETYSQPVVETVGNIADFLREFTGDDFYLLDHPYNNTTDTTTTTRIEKVSFKEPSALGDRLKSSIFGQDTAIDSIVKSLYIPISGLHDDTKPLRSFLFLGPTGVGKTELSLNLAKELTVEELPVVRVDMSEYQGAHEVSKLFGSPPGYLGHDTSYSFLDKVKENHHCIIILDEVEKAHPKIWDAFLQVLDKGRMTSGAGETIDFTKTIIIMTSNLGSKELKHSPTGFFHGSEKEQYDLREKNSQSIINKALEKEFRPEFINRIDSTIIFKELNKESIKSIVHKEIGLVIKRLEKQGITLTKPNPHVIRKIIELSHVTKYGAREIQRVIGNNVSSLIAEYTINNRNKKNLKLRVCNGDILVEDF